MVVREERFFCAVLFHLMLSDENFLRSFLVLCGVERHNQPKNEDIRVFVEYAMARDLWNSLRCGKSAAIEEANKRKADFIAERIHSLKPELDQSVLVRDFKEFNSALVGGRVSSKEIQSPARWSMKKLDKKLSKKRDELQTACKLKFAFNIKPDIVIEMGCDSVVCIEAKVESAEANYDVRSLKIEDFKCRQTDVQRFLMSDLLGFKTVYQVFLSKQGNNPNRKRRNDCDGQVSISWKEVFADVNPQCATVRTTIERLLSLSEA